MKNLVISLTTIILLFIAGCSTAHQFHYSSTAHIPHYTSSTETVMNVVLNDGDNSRQYGVLTAVDDDTTKYLLIAPKRVNQLSTKNHLTVFNVTQATYIDLHAAGDFKDSLEKIVSEWDNLGDDDGYFYEFSSVPEIDVRMDADNNVTYVPSIRFFFNATSQGSTGELIIEYHNSRTKEAIIRTFDMDTKIKVEDLHSLIDRGINYLD